MNHERLGRSDIPGPERAMKHSSPDRPSGRQILIALIPITLILIAIVIGSVVDL